MIGENLFTSVLPHWDQQHRYLFGPTVSSVLPGPEYDRYLIEHYSFVVRRSSVSIAKRMIPRILIADDQQAVLYTLRRELESDASLAVCGEALNGAEAVAKAQELHPDLIILDLAMPTMNGIEAARAIAKILPGVPILLFTLNDLPEVRAQAASAGVREVISKESGVKGLRIAIESALKKEEKTDSTIVSGEIPMVGIDSAATPRRDQTQRLTDPGNGSAKPS
jgi:DNA-binding NarL/FixJ family response regulator